MNQPNSRFEFQIGKFMRLERLVHLPVGLLSPGRSTFIIDTDKINMK